MADALQLISLLAAAILTGNELGTWAVVHPALHTLSFRDEVRAEQAITRRYGFFMPGLMLVTIVSGFAAAATVDGEARTLLLCAAGCFTAMLAITLIGNVPINVRTLAFEDGDEAQWRRLRRRWDRLHLARILLDLTGLLLVAVAAVD